MDLSIKSLPIVFRKLIARSRDILYIYDNTEEINFEVLILVGVFNISSPFSEAD